MGKLQAKFEQMSLTGIPQSKSGPIMDVHGQELALQGDERDLNRPKPGHTSDLSAFPQVWLPVHIANYSMQRSQGTQMLPPGQKQQSLNRRASVLHEPCAPQAQSDPMDISGFLCLQWPCDAETTKEPSTSAMWVRERRDARGYWPCRARGGILKLISISRKDDEASQQGGDSFWSRRV